ncbi:MAG: hydroxyacylglutathione hydrolase [Aestuariivita sp.]|nr:hydroxyacylglutathione hydrolase [Aestuariivita sp.]
MSLKTITIPCLSDNYAFISHETTSGQTALIDIPEASPILKKLDELNWKIDYVLITHHHDDHISGLREILAAYPNAQVIGAKADVSRLPPLNIAVSEGDTITIGNEQGTIIDVSGHTIGHIAYYFEKSGIAFTADSLMALGCGRVFEGTMPQMWNSLQKLAQLPPKTILYSGHEYTQSNGEFALTIDPNNILLKERIADIKQLRQNGTPTIPSTLSTELETNPFLRAKKPEIMERLGMPNAQPAEIFAEIRKRKDTF